MPTSRQAQYDKFSLAISRVITPVMICMALSVWFVQSLGDAKNCKRLGNGRKIGEISLSPAGPGSNSPGNDAQYSALMAGIFIAIFVVLMVAFTFLLVWLYRTGRSKYIIAWLMIAVFLIFAYVGGLYIFDFCRSRCINMDWITLCLAVWNFTVTGLFAVFGVVPRVINQAYLIVMSALMAYIFRTLPNWALWTILALLVLWDLFAVLSPYGPLKMLVNAARERGDPLPALVYDTNPIDIGRDDSAQPAFPLRQKKQNKQATQDRSDGPPRRGLLGRRKQDPIRGTSEEPTETTSEAAETTLNPRARSHARPRAAPAPGRPTSNTSTSVSPPDGAVRKETRSTESGDGETKLEENDANAAVGQPAAGDQPRKWLSFFTRKKNNANDAAANDGDGRAARSNRQRDGAQDGNNDNLDVGTMGAHLKLGLGDFVFYSILVAQASQSGAMTTVASFVAILAGLCATLFLVTIYRMALPALPISITAGLLFYFLTRFTVQPFVENLVPELLFY